MREHLASVAFQLNPQHRTCLRKSKMMTNHVRTEIIKGVKAAKYFAALFDSTPDILHTDQFTQILRYVKIQDGSVEVKESFVDFIAQCQRRPVPYRCYFVKDYCWRSGLSRLQGTGLRQYRYNGRETFRCAVAFASGKLQSPVCSVQKSQSRYKNCQENCWNQLERATWCCVCHQKPLQKCNWRSWETYWAQQKRWHIGFDQHLSISVLTESLGKHFTRSGQRPELPPDQRSGNACRWVTAQVSYRPTGLSCQQRVGYGHAYLC